MTETTQKPKDSKGGLLGEGVRVGVVSVGVGDETSVAVAVADDVIVALGVTVKGSGVADAVSVESGVDVGRSGVSSCGRKIKNSRRMSPISAGMV